MSKITREQRIEIYKKRKRGIIRSLLRQIAFAYVEKQLV